VATTKASDNQYLGNPNLKKTNVPFEYTEEQVAEYAKCMKDPLYFIQTYMRIVSLDEGLVPFDMYNFQKEMVDTFHNVNFLDSQVSQQQS
jgi:hypothetical protein